jgi:hypothetical protein
MSDQDSNLTEAQKQILKLEKLRAQKEQSSKASVEKAFFPPKTKAEQSFRKLQAMREAARSPRKKKKLEGKSKNFKLSALQTQVLERLKAQDPRLKSAVVARIALNRFLDIENSFDENDLEARVFEILRQFNTKNP